MKNNIKNSREKNLNLLMNLSNWLLLLISGFVIYINPYRDIYASMFNADLSPLAMFPTLLNNDFINFCLIIIACILLLISLIFAISSLIKSKKKPNIFLPLLTFIFALIVLIFSNNYLNCASFFQFCRNGWHYENNYLGQRVSVHYKVDLFGKEIKNSFVGCEYGGNLNDYNNLIMQSSGVKIIDDNANQRTYQFSDGSKGYLNKKTQPYADNILLNAISNLMFKGTSCVAKNLKN